VELLPLAKDIAKVLYPALPIEQGAQLILKLLEMDFAGGVVELTEEELDAFQRSQLEGGGA
jgi:hypothetical protein